MSNPKNMQKFNDLDFAGLSTSDWMHPSSANNNSGWDLLTYFYLVLFIYVYKR